MPATIVATLPAALAPLSVGTRSRSRTIPGRAHASANRELPDRGLVPSIECDGRREGGGALKKRHIPVGRARVSPSRIAERDESRLADSIERLRFLTRDGRP